MNTIKIGNQEWTTENLNVTDNGLGKDHWKNPKNDEVYYSYEAAMRIANKIPGFHLPTVEEWNQLAEACKCVCTNPSVKTEWMDYKNTQELKNKLGIKLIGFYTDNVSNFVGEDSYTYFWTTTEKSRNSVYYKSFEGEYYMLCDYSDKEDSGLSVRLVKD